MNRQEAGSKKQYNKEAKMLRNFRGSTGARAVIAVLMLLFVVACSGSDSGIKRERDEARAAAEAAEQARMEAEAAAAAAAEKAAADAAAAAAAAERAAEEAAAQARQEVIAEQQRTAVMNAVAAAQAAVAALMDASSDTDVAGATADIAAATAAIAAATTMSEADMAMYTAQVTAIQADLTLAEANIRAYRAEMAAQEAMNQATASARAKQAVDEAIAALAAANEAEAMSTATYTAAAAALSTAQTAVANADADTLADASAALAAALADASAAAADLAVKTQAVTDATTALEAARATLAQVDPTHVALQAANAALETAKTEAQSQADAIKALQQQIADLQKAEEDRKNAAADKAKADELKAMADSGKALLDALGKTPLMNLRADNTATPALHNLTSAGLAVGIPNADNTASTSSPRMKAVEGSAGMLGDWKSMEYADTNTGTKVTHNAMVYTNQGDPTTETFANEYGTGGDSAAEGTSYDADDRELVLAAGGLGTTDGNKKIKGSAFSTVGTTTHTPADGANELSVSGMYDGASGTYYCTPADGAPCTSAPNTNGITLAGAWRFVHSPNAMISRPDADYLYFGWWLTKDKDGKPTSASAFTGVAGDAPTALTGVTSIVGSATYAGKAAGKFAIYNPLDNTGDAGHFTADATLTAKFNGSAGVTGTINNFMANEKAVPWSVALNNKTMTTDDPPVAATNLDATGGIANVADTTVWSIDGNSAAASGTWSGQMYGTVKNSDVPANVTGRFESSFGSIGQMVGAFGAEKQ